jgi:glycosyltransferase involved in cell wall biosynthesis
MWNNQATCWLWHERELLFWVEYVPFVVVALWLWLRGLRAPAGGRAGDGLISVVIPTLNERDNIAGCIESVRKQGVQVEVVVADGGSTDGTRELVASLDEVKLVDALPGRGIQVRAGAQASTGSVILILHADSRLLPSALSRLATRLKEKPAVLGGSFGACYEHPSLRFRLTEFINSARAFVLGISFGDQGQFFRRSALLDDLPPYRLMEDIEISYRLKERGEVTFIPSGLLSSLRAWKRRGYLGNLTKVVSLFSLYVVRRRLGMLSGDCSDFQRWYYGR